MYDVSSLVATIRSWAKDTSLPETLIIQWLDDTQQDILGEQVFSFMERTETATLSVDDTEHQYPADHQTTERIWLIDPDESSRVYEVKYLEPRKFFALVPSVSALDANLPKFWTDFGRVIKWSTPLDKDYELKHQYIKRVTPLTEGSNNPELPREYKNILTFGGMARTEEYRGNFDMAGVYDMRKEKRAEDMALRYAPRQFGKLGMNNSPWAKGGENGS